MSVSVHIQGIFREINEFNKEPDQMHQRSLLVRSLNFIKLFRQGHVYLSDPAPKEIKELTKMLKNEDDTVKRVCLDILSVFCEKWSESVVKEVIIKTLQAILEVVKNYPLEDKIFQSALMAYRRVCKVIKAISDSGKDQMVHGNADAKKTLNQYSQNSIKVLTVLCREQKVWHSRLCEEDISDEIYKRRSKSIELSLYCISSLMDYPSGFKTIISSKNSDVEGNFVTSLINLLAPSSGSDRNLHNDDLCRATVAVLSKVFMIKDKRAESYAMQVQTILDSINGFYRFIKPEESKNVEQKSVESYREFVRYHFLGKEPNYSFSAYQRMVDLLFALLKTTLNQKKNIPYFKFLKININDVLNNLEGILSENAMDPSKSSLILDGLSAEDFNALLPVMKIQAMQCLRILLNSGRLTDKVSWIRKCIYIMLNNDSIMRSHSLLTEFFDFFKDCIRVFKYGLSSLAGSLWMNSTFIIHPDIMNHILAMIKIILLRVDKTVVKVTGYTSLKAGLKVDENMKDVSPEYTNMSTVEIEARLKVYLSFVATCVKEGVINRLKRSDLAHFDSRLHTILQLSHFKFFPLSLSVKKSILEVVEERIRVTNYGVHNNHILDSTIKFLEMEEQEPMNYEIKKLLDQIRRSTSVFAGRFEKNRSDEVQKMESNYSKMWVEANKKQLSELLLNEKKKRDVKYFNKLQEESINHGEEITALDSTNPQALTRQNCPPPGLRPIGRPNEVSSQDQNILQVTQQQLHQQDRLRSRENTSVLHDIKDESVRPQQIESEMGGSHQLQSAVPVTQMASDMAQSFTWGDQNSRKNQTQRESVAQSNIQSEVGEENLAGNANNRSALNPSDDVSAFEDIEESSDSSSHSGQSLPEIKDEDSA